MLCVAAAALMAACDVMDVADLASSKGGATRSRPAQSMPPPQLADVPAGTELTLALDKMLSSRTSRAGDAFSATVVEPIVIDGLEVIPAGSTLEGKVTEATSAQGGARRATLAVAIGALRFETGYRTDIVGRFQEFRPSGRAQDAALVEWSATGGRLRERIMGKDTRGMVIGAIVGKDLGTVSVMNNSGAQVILPVDTPFGFKLEQPIRVP
jgi:hypothetical protein